MKNNIWIHKDFEDEYLNEVERMEREWLWGPLHPRKDVYKDDIKLAWVFIDKNRTMIGVNNKDLKGFKLDARYPIVALPLEEITYDSFERWCTSFDV